jgi:BirA family transcriptional regulator, biotin operon repressor / biotin---[acetyl-CoA-carboxylase] ligase
MAEPATLPAGFRREAFESLPSTNSTAFASARDDAATGLWVTAAIQTAGRGRRGRPWESGPGNLAASLLLIDPAPAELVATISFVAGVALHQAVVDLAGPAVADRLRLKWPNDLLLDRMKVAGISVEGDKLASGKLAVVIGVGVNCRTHPETGTIHTASDFGARGVPLEAEALFLRLATRMAEELSRWDRGGNFAATRRAWLARSLGLGEPIRVNLAARTIDGRFDTLDEEGRLVLTRNDGARETISAGDVFFRG